MLTKFVAADLHKFGNNKHAFLSDNRWVEEEKDATLYNNPMFAVNMAVEYRAHSPHCIKVQIKE